MRKITADWQAVTGPLQQDLRTREARGEGTDARLVLLEAAMVCGLLDVLDARLQQLAGESPVSHNPRGLQRALRPGDPVHAKLAAAWEGHDLTEVTLRLR